MCYHSSTPKTEKLYDLLGSGYTIQPYTSYFHANGFNHPELPLLASHEADTIKPYSWGLIPFFAKDIVSANDIRKKTLNARCETIFELASFKGSAKSKRCLIFVDGFFEWEHQGKEKIPYFIYSEEHQPFAFGGLYNQWVNKENGEVFDTLSIITTPANELMSKIHNSQKRMPFILSQEHWSQWLDKTVEVDTVKTMMKPLQDGILHAHKISKLITSRTQDANVPDVQVEVGETLF